jgi:hypothetical protein
MTVTYTGPSNNKMRAIRQAERAFADWQRIRDDDQYSAKDEADAWADYKVARALAEEIR